MARFRYAIISFKTDQARDDEYFELSSCHWENHNYIPNQAISSFNLTKALKFETSDDGVVIYPIDIIAKVKFVNELPLALRNPEPIVPPDPITSDNLPFLPE